MEDIRKIFLMKTIPDFLSWEFDMPYIKFLFDLDTLKSFNNYLDKDDNDYNKGLNSIKYLTQIYQESKTDKDQLYIPVHDSKRFFELLEKLVESYSKKKGHALLNHYNFIRSIWLRMGVNDINDVEGFLERQITFIRGEAALPDYKEIKKFDEHNFLAYSVNENDDWFEINKNIVFSLRRSPESFLEPVVDYSFPAIHFAFGKSDGKITCFIYGIQSLNECHNEEIKNDLQPIRKKLRNKSVSADFIIGLSLFFDYLYDQGVTNIEIPTLQVFNYLYHVYLSKNIFDNFSSYTESDIAEIEDLINQGVYTDKVTDYLHTKKMTNRFVDKEDSISYNKSERLINILLELVDRYPTIELMSEPFIHGENLKIKLNGKANILADYCQKKELHM